ncbi:MAG: protein kinase [Planctomycetes bacterium]|nr:protein kinase [Planctomycetota bacterium]
MSERELFQAALAILDTVERTKFLNAQCAADSPLRERVELLLRAHDGAGSFLEHPALEADSADASRQSTLQLPASDQGETHDLGQDRDAGPVVPTRIQYIGDYELLEEIAHGGMGVVFKAKQASLNRVVAVKMILKGELATPADVQRFRAEAEAAAQLDHPNIVPIYEIGEHQGRHYFSMRLIEGSALRPANWSEPRKAGRLVATIAHAVHYAHQRGILHRDVKPANILIDEHGEPHVMDFGLAKRVDKDVGATRTGAVVGTPSYMPPEQARGEKGLTVAVDIYSLGAVLYELLTGRPPFKGDSVMATLLQVLEQEPVRPRTLNRSIDRDLEVICLKCLDKDPKQRYGSAEQLADDLKRWLDGEPIHARPAAVWELGLKWAKRRPAMAGLLAALAGVFVIGVGLVLWQWGRAETANGELRTTAELLAKTAEEERASREDAETRRQQAEVAQGEAVKARGDAETRRQQAESARRGEQQTSARLALERGIGLLEQGNMNHGLLWVGKSMTLAPPDDTALIHAAWSNLAAWAPRMNTARWRRHMPGGVASVEFLPDSPCLIVGGEDSRVRCWDTVADRETWISPQLAGPPGALGISRDRKRVAAGTSTGEFYVFDATNGKPTGERMKAPAEVRSIAFSPNGEELLVGVADGKAQRYDARTGKSIGEPLTQPHPITTVAYSPSGHEIITGSQRSDPERHLQPAELAQRWDATTGKPVGVAVDHPLGVRALAYQGVGRPPRLAPQFEMRMYAGVGSLGTGQNLDISPDGRYLATAGYDYRFRVWDLVNKSAVGQVTYHSGWMHWAKFGPDGRTILSGIGSSLQLWDFAGVRRPRDVILDLPANVSNFAFSPSGKTVATAAGKEVRLFDAGTGEPLGAPIVFPTGFPHFKQSLAVGADDRSVVVALGDKTVRLLDCRTGKELIPALEHPEGLECVALSLNGKVIATGCGHQVRAWDATTGKPLAPPMATHGGAWGLALSPDGQTGLIGSSNYFLVDFWDTASGKQLGRVHPAGCIGGLAVSHDGKRFAGTSWGDSVVRFGDVEARKFEGRILEQPFGHNNLTFSSDGRLLATGGEDKIVRVFDVNTGMRVGPLFTCAKPIKAVGFGENGRSVMAASEDGIVRQWELPSVWSEMPKDLPQRAELWARLLTGLQLDELGQGQPVGQFQPLRDQIAALGGAPGDLTPTPEQIRVWHRQEANDDIGMKQWSAARWHLDKLLAIDPKDMNARADRARVLLAMGDADAAKADIAQLPEGGGRDWKLWEMRGLMAQRQGQRAEAATAFATAAELRPLNYDLVRCWVACLVLADDQDGVKKATAEIRERVVRQFGPSETGLRMIQALGSAGDAATGWDELHGIASKAWRDHWPQHVVAKSAYRAGKLDKAVQAANISLGFYSVWPPHVNNWLLLAAAHHRRGDEAESRRWYEKATVWIDKAVREQSADALAPGNLDVPDWLECQILRREVEKLIGKKDR